MPKNTISNWDDVIDSRDVIDRIDELKDERDDLEGDAITKFDESDDGQELKVLQALAEEASGYAADWEHGETLIRESYFVKYCQDLLDDLGELPKDLPSYIAIDWDETADNLKVDYTEVDFEGVTYLIR